MATIQYICFTGFTGFATAAKNNICALSQRDHAISVVPLDLGFNKKVDPTLFDFYNSLVSKNQIPGAISLYHCVPFMQRRFRTDGVKIGYATFETLEPPPEWRVYFDSYKIIITPSEFNYNIFREQGCDNLLYLPHIIDFTKFHKNVRPVSLNKVKSSFNFLWIGTWKKRKNYELLMRAFLEEFGPDEDVGLVMKTSQQSVKNHESVVKRIKAEIRGKRHFPEIHFDKTLLSDDVMPSYIKSFQAFVSPSRGEGFGLPGLHAMAVGVPVITTNFSGIKDYANDQTATMLEIDGFERLANMDSVVQFNNKKWPIIKLQELRKKIRLVHSKYKEAQLKADFATTYVQKRFGYEQIQKLVSVLNDM